MYRKLIGGALAALCCAVPAFGQDDATIIPGEQNNATAPQATPADQNQAQMNAQEQANQSQEAYRFMQQKPTPRELVQQRAALQGAQRRMRIASREWYGISLARPMASPVPHMGIYSAQWAGTYREPALWSDQYHYGGTYENYRDYRIYNGGFR